MAVGKYASHQKWTLEGQCYSRMEYYVFAYRATRMIERWQRRGSYLPRPLIEEA
jgi:hypothetical protein